MSTPLGRKLWKVAAWLSVGAAALVIVGLLLPAPKESNPGGDAAKRPLTGQQIRDARLALCIAASDEYEDVAQGKPHKDAIILANQYAVGERASGTAIGHEWLSYQNGAWGEPDCHSLSIAPWAPAEGYAGGALTLPRGAIAAVVKSPGWAP